MTHRYPRLVCGKGAQARLPYLTGLSLLPLALLCATSPTWAVSPNAAGSTPVSASAAGASTSSVSTTASATPAAAPSAAVTAGGNLASSTAAPAATPEKLEAWTADPKEVTVLTPPDVILGFSFQGPVGWEILPRGGPGKIGRLYRSAPEFAGMRASYQVMLFGIPGGNQDKRTVEEFLDFRLNNIKRQNNDWVQTPIDVGTIYGLKFARRRFTGTDMQSGTKISGFMYVGRTDTELIEISSEDLADHASQTQPLCETAAKTFHKLADMGVQTNGLGSL